MRASLGQRIRYILLQRLLPGTRLDRLASRQSQAFQAVSSVLTDDSDPEKVRFRLDRLIERYGEVVWVYVAISKNAQSAASVPLKAYKTAQDGDKEEITDGPLVQMLKRPNDWQSCFDFVESHQSSMELAGESFIELDRGPSGGGKIKGMYVLPIFNEDTMKVLRDPNAPPGPDGPVLGYIYKIQGREVPFLPTEMIHVKYYNPFDPFRGMPPLRAGSMAVSSDVMAQKYNLGFFTNAARPEGHYESDGVVTEGQFKRFQKMIEARHRGYRKAHRPLLLQGVKWVSTQLKPKDAEFIIQRKLNREEIIALYGVRPVVVGLLEKNPQANADVQWRDYWTATMMPRLRKLTDKLNAELVPEFGGVGSGVSVEFDYSGIAALQENFSEQVVNAFKLWQMGYPINAINRRMSLGMEDMEWGDTVLVSPLLVPIEMAASGEKAIDIEAKVLSQLQVVPTPKMLSDGLQVLKDRSVEEKKTRALEIFTVRQAEMEKEALPKLKAFFEAQRRRVQKSLKTEVSGKSSSSKKRAPVGIDISILLTIPDEIALMEGVNREILRETLLDSMLFFAASNDIAETGLNFVSDSILGYLRDESFRQAKNITETTRDRLKVAMTEALNRGESITQIADRIDELFADRVSSAETIARTETVSASNFGNREAALQSGAGSKSWISAGDHKVRHPHRLIDFQSTAAPVPIAFPYTLSDGSQLLHPGDGSLGAAAAQVVNCRCTELYYFD